MNTHSLLPSYRHRIELCIGAGKTEPHGGGATMTGDCGVGGYSDNQIQTHRCAASSVWQILGLPVTSARPSTACRLLVYGLHFTLTPPPVLTSSLPVRGHTVVCSALCSAL